MLSPIPRSLAVVAEPFLYVDRGDDQAQIPPGVGQRFRPPPRNEQRDENTGDV